MTQDTSMPPSDGGSDDELSLSEWVSILLDGWKVIAIIGGFSILIAAGYLFTLVPEYTATGTLQVTSDDGGSTGALLDLAGMQERSKSETEVEILRSNRIIQTAARRLKLNITHPMSKFTVDTDVTLHGHSPLNAELLALRDAISEISIADWVERGRPARIRRTANGIDVITKDTTQSLGPGDTYAHRGISFVLEKMPSMDRPDVEVRFIPDDRLVRSLSDRFSMSTIGGRKETSLVRISFVYPDRNMAKHVVNALMDAYMEFALSWKTERASRSAEFIEAQMESIRQSLESTEARLQQFLEASGAVLLPEQARTLIGQGATLDLELKKIRMREDLMKQVSFHIFKARKNDTSLALTGDFLAEDDLLGKAISQLNDLELQKETLLAEFKPVHPRIRRLSGEIDRIHQQIDAYVKNSRSQMAEKRRAIDHSLESIQDELAAFPEKERTLATLRRDQEVGQELYTFLMKKLEESNILKASTTIDKRIIDPATSPFEKSSPRRLPTLMMAALLGGIFGVVFVLGRRSLDPHVRDEEEARHLTELPVYGVVPNLRYLGFRAAQGSMVKQIWQSPKGPAAESFRTFRTNLEFSQTPEHPIKVVQFTSTGAGEGKSTVISNLAASLAKAGNRVILMDLDLRRPTQHQIWEVPRSPGITDFLTGRGTLQVHREVMQNVDVVTAGYEPPECQRLLASDALRDRVKQWSDEYDYVLLDTSPLLVADSLVISRMCHMLFFVVRPGKCRRSALRLSCTTYRKMNLVKGLVINGSTSRKGGYYHYYRGSYYGSKTSETQES